VVWAHWVTLGCVVAVTAAADGANEFVWWNVDTILGTCALAHSVCNDAACWCDVAPQVLMALACRVLPTSLSRLPPSTPRTAADKRYRSLGREWLNRREFKEVFTDLNVIVSGESFLQLSSLVFAAFEDLDHPGRVSGVEVMLAMLMFCHGCPASVQLKTITSMWVWCGAMWCGVMWLCVACNHPRVMRCQAGASSRTGLCQTSFRY